jgi:hypothetical protein
MIRGILTFALCAMLLALCVPVQAQQLKKLPRIGYLVTAGDPGNPDSPDIGGPKPDLEGAFRDAVKGRVNALITTRSDVLVRNAKRIADLTTKNRLPLMAEGSDFVEAGALVSYATDDAESYRRAATYVDKILKGAKAC